MEAGEPTTSKTVSEAAFCLHADETSNPYTQALKAYALALSHASDAELAMQKLISSATDTSNSMYWKLPEESGNERWLHVVIVCPFMVNVHFSKKLPSEYLGTT